MKLCPKCQTRYDEKDLRFCKKDGTPLIEDNKPTFTHLPSENLEDDEGDVTVIRRKSSQSESQTDAIPPAQPDLGATNVNPRREDSQQVPADRKERIVIPTEEEEKIRSYQQVRAKTSTPGYIPPLEEKKSNTIVVVLLTMIGTIVVMGVAFGAFWVLSNQGNQEVNENLNANFDSFDENLNTNLDLDNFNTDDFNTNANGNENSNLDSNFNSNFNISTPTQTPTPSPTQTPDANTNANVANTNANAATPTPSTPRPTPTPTRPPTRTPTPAPTRTPASTPTPPNSGNTNSN